MMLIFVITNGYITSGKVTRGFPTETRSVKQSDIYFFTKNSYLTFEFDESYIRGDEAFQGFITYEQESPKSCLLSGRNESFEISNISEIYYLRSHYDALYDREAVKPRRCLWKFIAPNGYGFKVETLDINMEWAYLYPHLYVVTPKTRDYIIGPLIRYYSENEIAISYNDYNRSFEAKISIYKIPLPLSVNSCIISEGIWQSPPNIEYGNILHCWHQFEIQPFHQLHISVNFVFNETGNNLKFYSDQNTFFPLNISTIGEFVFLPFTNNTVRRLTFEYKSDEQIINKAFKIEFKNIKCKCAPLKLVIPCDGHQIYSIMGRDDYVYCTNMKCNFTIAINETCSYHHIELETNIKNPNFDHLSIISDTDLLINADYSPYTTQKYHKVLILPNHTTIMHFESSYNTSLEWLNTQSLTIKTASYGIPNSWPDFIISDKTPIFYNEQMNKHSIVTIKLSDKLMNLKAELEIYFDQNKFNTKCVSFYENNKLISLKPIKKSIETLGISVTIYKHYSCLNDSAIFVIRAKKADSNGCRFSNTTIITNGRDRISMVAGSNTFCELVFLNTAKSNIIKNIFTNSKTENVLLYNNANKTNELLKFNEGTFHLYKQITFNARIYILSIPPNSSIFFETMEQDITKFTEPISSYYETPKYGALFAAKYHEATFYQISDGFEAEFTVKDFDVSEKGCLRISQNDKTKNFTALNETFVVNSENGNKVEIYFAEPKFGYRGAMLSITVYPKNNEDVTPEAANLNTIPSIIVSENSTSTTPTSNVSNPQKINLSFIVFSIFNILCL